MIPTGILPIAQLQPGDKKCENFAFVATVHPDARDSSKICDPGNRLIPEDELSPIGDTDTFAEWTCGICGHTEERYIPLNSDVSPN